MSNKFEDKRKFLVKKGIVGKSNQIKMKFMSSKNNIIEMKIVSKEQIAS